MQCQDISPITVRSARLLLFQVSQATQRDQPGRQFVQVCLDVFRAPDRGVRSSAYSAAVARLSSYREWFSCRWYVVGAVSFTWWLWIKKTICFVKGGSEQFIYWIPLVSGFFFFKAYMGIFWHWERCPQSEGQVLIHLHIPPLPRTRICMSVAWLAISIISVKRSVLQQETVQEREAYIFVNTLPSLILEQIQHPNSNSSSDLQNETLLLQSDIRIGSTDIKIQPTRLCCRVVISG